MCSINVFEPLSTFLFAAPLIIKKNPMNFFGECWESNGSWVQYQVLLYAAPKRIAQTFYSGNSPRAARLATIDLALALPTLNVVLGSRLGGGGG